MAGIFDVVAFGHGSRDIAGVFVVFRSAVA
jgi:hypothetical protein